MEFGNVLFMCDLTLNFIQLPSVSSVHLQMTCFEISADVTDQAFWVFKFFFFKCFFFP